MSDSDLMSDRGQENVATGKPELSEGAWTGWLMSCFISLTVSFITAKMIFGIVSSVDFISGWGLASTNALFSMGINVIAMKRQRHGFIAWGAVGNVLRVLAVLVIILSVKLTYLIRFEPFVLVFLVSYFVFMIVETVRMNVVNLRSMQQK
ncbi:MAG: hypothetical protein A2283_12550 [Lentisphaerae bacterium RIFOXYA12_FULL_48_11]|nr:MAG: hypothetical protein A2283_12550 [Lentisphaerae bacterium RIFOXYA12_FULL_48_11]